MSQRQTRPRRDDARRVGVLLFVALLAGAFTPAPMARATQTICVALVVDFTPLNGGVDSGCTRVPQGATGYDVLRAGGHTFEVCSNGVIGTIDGQPANGCQVKDNTHFWGYWHRKPGSRTWTFSSYGAAIYHPVEGSTEGWVWENGSTTPPADVPYPAGCHSPPTSPTPTPSTRSDATTSSSPPAGPQQQGNTAGASTVTARSTTQPTTSRHHGSRSARPTATASSATPTTATTLPSPTASTTARVLTGAPPDGSSNGAPVAPVAAGFGIAALLGAGAWWRSRRSGALS